jgi:hypothetical protein
MAHTAKQITIGDYGIKIILFRVNVGNEKHVVESLMNRLDEEIKEKSNIIDYQFYKILGLYDIMIVLRCREFSHDLLKKGTFEHIIHSNEILCFPYFLGQEDKMSLFNLDNSKKAVFISLLKIRMEPLLKFGMDLQDAIALYMERETNLMILGGLGWNEFLVINPHNFKEQELEYIFNTFISETSSLFIGADDNNIPLIHKMYSLMGVSYDVINNLEETFPSEFVDSSRGPCPRLLISVPGHNFNSIFKRLPRYFKRGTDGFDYPGLCRRKR